MEHKLVDTGWESPDELDNLIGEYARDGWSVTALGKFFGGEFLVLARVNEIPANHEVIPVEVDSISELKMVIAEKIAEGYEICAMGECAGVPVIVAKKKKN